MRRHDVVVHACARCAGWRGLPRPPPARHARQRTRRPGSASSRPPRAQADCLRARTVAPCSPARRPQTSTAAAAQGCAARAVRGRPGRARHQPLCSLRSDHSAARARRCRPLTKTLCRCRARRARRGRRGGECAAGHRGLDAYTHSTARRAPRAARRVGGRVPIDVSPAHAPFLPRLPPAPVLSRPCFVECPVTRDFEHELRTMTLYPRTTTKRSTPSRCCGKRDELWAWRRGRRRSSFSS